MTRFCRSLCLAVFVLSEVLAGQCFADLIASDGFDYAVGPLSGNGGVGWNGGWTAADDLQVESPGLTYTDSSGVSLATSGNKVRPSFSADGESFRVMSSGSIGADGTSVWIAFLAEGPATSPDSTQNFRWGGISLFDGTNDSSEERLFLGKPADEDFFWGTLGPVIGDRIVSDVPTTDPVLFVTQIEFGSGDETVRIWLNPDLDSTPLPGDAAITETVSNFQFDRVRIAGSNDFAIDELRIGTTFSSVAPTPEPSSFALLGFGLCSLLGYGVRRRRAVGFRS